MFLRSLSRVPARLAAQKDTFVLGVTRPYLQL